MSRSLLTSAVLALPLAALLGCSSAAEVGGGDDACTTCHGGAANAAPPTATTGATATSDPRVGAHQVHLQGGALGVPVACAECHPVPTSSGHANGVIEVAFGAFAKTGGRTPTWSAGSATCADVYCHGSGGAASTPLWTRVDGSQSDCGGCHATPPTANGHPQVTLIYCSGCHPDTIDAAGALKLAGKKHLDGTVQSVAFSHPSTWVAGHQPVALADSAVGCKACHGSDLKGGTSGQSCWTCHPAGPPI